ncbi:MAG: hypothetical protein IJZ19_05815 [Lentisphaeria bacterium]|nr:hypothetical protein [Lentisphaeria bacterium]
MSVYLCYDLKGIQQYIFQIPKLTCCIGGSRQIDDFDRNVATREIPDGCSHIYSGGGKGAFCCEAEKSLTELKQYLVKQALDKGLTIRFGIDADYGVAAREIKETYCFQPDSLEGQPCRLSGLFPVKNGGIHPLIQAREELGRSHGNANNTEGKFLKALQEKFSRTNLSFFYNVNANDDRDGELGAAALGNRNRWAVVCMDGNDMGMQFLKFKEGNHSNEEWQQWLREMSPRLDECTCQAALAGMTAVTGKYLEENPSGKILPLRPLIVGGDDVTVLVSCNYAMLFVKTVMQSFNAESKKYASLWVGTKGEMTISAGILYAPVTLPLHSALSYTESLLASAKTHGRELKKQQNSQVSPACLDWESVTESMLDSPAARRQREFLVSDGETGKTIQLSSRPYSQVELEEIEEIQKTFCKHKIPNTIRYQLHPELKKSKPERMAYYAKVKKNHPVLTENLMEPLEGICDRYGKWWHVENETQRTCVIDALLLIQEENRMTKETVSNWEESCDD